MILLIDNYDSFTYNLVQRLGEIDPSLDLEVHRNDQITIDEVVVSGDKVWARQKGGGTNLGSFAGHPPTGIKAFTDVIDLVRIEDGKIVEHWGVPDQLGMMMQLGHIPQPVRR